MSQYYKPKRSRNLYQPEQEKPFKLSRSKLELFVECPRCFYIDRRLGTGRPPGFPFNLNSAVDALLKQEFDQYRAQQQPHPYILDSNIDAIPAKHDDLDRWRENFKGVEYLHKPTNLLISGAIDDLWQNPAGEYIVVDYKATSKNEDITMLDKAWQNGYKRQMEIYQWLLRKNGYQVANTGYFVYCNGKRNLPAFDNKLKFDVTVIPYAGNDNWVEQTIFAAYECLNSNQIPPANTNCDYCAYIDAILGLNANIEESE